MVRLGAARRRRLRDPRSRRLHDDVPARLRAGGLVHHGGLCGRCCGVLRGRPARSREGSACGRPRRARSSTPRSSPATPPSSRTTTGTRRAGRSFSSSPKARCATDSVGGVLVPVALIPYLAFNEWYRGHEFGPPAFLLDRVTFPSGVMLLVGLIFGWLVHHLEEETRVSAERTAEAERLRDELGRRSDVLEAANRVARALASSLELDAAFGAFIRELRGLVPFERAAIVLVEGDTATTMATAGRGANEVFPPGNAGPLAGSVLGQVLEGRIVVRRDLEEREFPEDELLLALGLRSELVAPLQLGARTIGMLSLSRADAGCVQRERDRARRPARPPRRHGRPEHPRVRGRTPTGRRARAAFGAARGLRVARLPRAAQPDGGCDRCVADVAGAVAPAERRAAGVVPRAHRRRDDAARGPRRRRPRHLAPRGGDVQLPLRGRRPRGDRARRRGVGDAHATGGRSGADGHRQVADDSRRPGATPPGGREPHRQRGQVLARARRGGGAGVRRRRRRTPLRPRRRPGDPARAPGAHLREVRPSRHPRQLEAGHRPRLVHRALDRRGARRHARGQLAPARGSDLRADACRRPTRPARGAARRRAPSRALSRASRSASAAPPARRAPRRRGSARISLSSHSSSPYGRSASAVPSVSRRAPRSAAKRATSFE